MVVLKPLKLDLRKVTESTLDSLLATLSAVSGSSILVLQKSLSGRLNSLTPFKALKEKGNIASALWLEDSVNGNVLASASVNGITSIVILCDSSVGNPHLIEKRIKELNSLSVKFNIYGVVVSEITKAFEFKLEQLGIKGDIQLFAWDFSVSVLASDLLCLEEDPKKVLRSLYLDNVDEPLYKMAKTLLGLVNKFPSVLVFDKVLMKGNKSSKFYEVYDSLRNEYLCSLNPVQRKQQELFEADDGSRSGSGVVDLVVIERGLDFITPMLNQLTYLGLVDELYKFEHNIVDLTGEKISDLSENAKSIKFELTDEILDKIKDLNFSAIGPILNKYAKDLQTQFEARHGLKKIDQFKEFVGKLTGLQKKQLYLKNHTMIAEHILEKVKGSTSSEAEENQATPADGDENDSTFSQVLELQQNLLDGYYDTKKVTNTIIDLIYTNKLSLNGVLKLCCLASKVNKGLPEKHYHVLKSEIISNFGIKHLITLQNLRELNLFYIKESSSYLLPLGATNTTAETEENSDVSYLKDFTSVKNFLNLTPSAEYDIDEKIQADGENDLGKDASYAFPNYVPITTRLVQSAYDRSYMNSSLSSYLTKTHSRYLSKSGSWKGMADLWRFLEGETKEISKYDAKTKNGEESLTMVVILGGVSYGELATMRYVESKLQKKGINRKFVFVTDCIVNGDKIMSSVIADDISDV